MSYNLGDDDNDHFLDSLLTPIETTFDPTEEKYEHGSYQFYRDPDQSSSHIPAFKNSWHSFSSDQNLQWDQSNKIGSPNSDFESEGDDDDNQFRRTFFTKQNSNQFSPLGEKTSSTKKKKGRRKKKKHVQVLGPKYPYIPNNVKIRHHSTSPQSKVDNSLAPLLLAFLPLLLGIGTALGLLVTGYSFGGSSSPTFSIGGTNVTVLVTNTISAASTATATNTNTNDNTLTATGRMLATLLSWFLP